MGRGDEQKKYVVPYLTVVNIDFASSEMPPLSNNGTFQFDVLDVCMSVKQFILKNTTPINAYTRRHEAR